MNGEYLNKILELEFLLTKTPVIIENKKPSLEAQSTAFYFPQ